MRSLVCALWVVVSIILYGVACILLSLVSKPLARNVGRSWCRHLLAIAGVKVEARGLDKLDPHSKYVIVSNHSSAFDIWVLMATLPFHLTFIAKKELFYIPIFGWGMWALGHVPVDRGSAKRARTSITVAVERLRKEKISLTLFPEGTRSPDGSVREFKPAAFTLAVEAQVPVVPVLCYGTHRILPKKDWRIQPGKVILAVADPIFYNTNAPLDKKALSQATRSAILALKEKLDTETASMRG
jgi:1-acyl-sn-glycerol-3-phosphate acyltransferase